MNTIVQQIINYLETQNSNEIINETNITCIETLNSACFEILSWLKLERKRELWISEGRKTSLKPLELNIQYDWCNLLAQIIENEQLFYDVFEIVDNKLMLRKDLPDETKSQIREDAYQLYNPLPIVN